MVRTMSNTLSDAIEIVVSTTMSEGRMPGTMTLMKRCHAFVPSSSAASICSVGTPLMAADRITIAKPVWIQISTTMRKSVFQGSTARNRYGCPPNHTITWLRRPICS